MSDNLFQQSEATAVDRRIFFTIFDDADGVTPKSGATGRMRISKGGASPFDTQTITDATNATPIVLTMTTAPADGSVVLVAGVGGNANANGRFLTKNRTSTTCELTDFAGTNIAGSGAYTSGGTLDVLELDSVNAIVEYAPAAYYLELDPTTELDVLGRGKASLPAVTGYLAVPPQFFDVVPYDPNVVDKDGFTLSSTGNDDVAAAVGARTVHGLTYDELVSAGGAMNIDITSGVLTVKHEDGTTIYTRDLTRAALDAIISAVP